jgi:hypothetical protein
VPGVTSARSVARFTVAPVTPGTVFNARSTCATQEAQVIPSTSSTTVEGLEGRGCMFIADPSGERFAIRT